MVPAFQIARLAVGVAASIPVSKIAKDVIANNVTIVTKADAFKVKAGSVIIGAMVGKALDNTIDSYINATRKTLSDLRNGENTDTPEENGEKVEQ